MTPRLRLSARLVACTVAAASLAACASQPMPSMSGSQPVSSGYGNPNNGYYPPPANNGGYNNGGYNNNNNGYNNGGYNNAQSNVAYGTVERVDVLDSRKDTGLGAVIGAGVGAIAGNQIGRSMNDAKTTGTIAGAVGGGLLGNAIERNQNKNNQVNRYYVRFDDGSQRYWDAPASQLNFQVGQRVRIQDDHLYAN